MGTLFLVIGCPQEKPETSTDVSISLPSKMTARSLSDNCSESLWADLLIDNQAVGKLQNNGNNWQGKINIPSGIHTLKIEFKCSTNHFGTLLLAYHTSNINTSSSVSLNASRDSYIYPDNDHDGTTNLAEIKADSDPGRASNGFFWANPLPQGNSLMDVIWNGSEFLAVGSGGSILTSGDGQSWSLSYSAASTFLNAIAWSGSRYVIVGHQGIILSRTMDDSDWSFIESNSKDILFDITWTGSQFVAVGLNTTASSADGINWEYHPPPEDSFITGVTWTGDKLVATGAAQNEDLKRIEGAFFTSHDGISWSSPQLTGTPMLWDITWTGSQLVAVGGDIWTGSDSLQEGVFTFQQGGIILTSQDAKNWTKQTSDTDLDLIGVHFDSKTGQIIAVGGNTDFADPNNSNTGIILTSPNGIDWSPQGSTFNHVYRSLASSGKETVVVGQSGIIRTSADLKQWDSQTNGSLNAVFDMVSTDNQTVAVSEHGEILTSYDGRSWASHNSGIISNLYAITWTGSQLVAVGGEISATSGGVIMSSTDGINWINRTPAGSLGLLTDIAWTGSQLIAIGAKGLLLTSPNGIDWTTQNSTVHQTLLTVGVSSSNQIVIAGQSGALLTSTDSGTSWTHIEGIDKNIHFFSITWTGSSFFIAGRTPDNENILLTSTDGLNWTPLTPQIKDPLQDIHWTGTRLLAITQHPDVFAGEQHSNLLTSTDGSTWSKIPTPSSNGVNCVIEYQGATLIGGGGGTILYRKN